MLSQSRCNTFHGIQYLLTHSDSEILVDLEQISELFETFTDFYDARRRSRCHNRCHPVNLLTICTVQEHVHLAEPLLQSLGLRFRRFARFFLKDRINELATNNKNKNIREIT
jgi:hypothetical protein